jgi:hypothetical protein
MVVARYGYLWNFERLIFWGDVGYLYLKPSVLYPVVAKAEDAPSPANGIFERRPRAGID